MGSCRARGVVLGRGQRDDRRRERSLPFARSEDLGLETEVSPFVCVHHGSTPT